MAGLLYQLQNGTCRVVHGWAGAVPARVELGAHGKNELVSDTNSFVGEKDR